MALNSQSFYISLPSAGNTDMGHYTWLCVFILFSSNYFLFLPKFPLIPGLFRRCCWLCFTVLEDFPINLIEFWVYFFVIWKTIHIISNFCCCCCQEGECSRCIFRCSDATSSWFLCVDFVPCYFDESVDWGGPCRCLGREANHRGENDFFQTDFLDLGQTWGVGHQEFMVSIF